MNRPDLSLFARRVRITVDDAINRRFPTETLARVVIVDRQGHRLVSSDTTPRGDVGRPMDWGDLREKFLRITAPKMGHEKQRAFLTGFHRFRQGDPAPLLAMLKQPLDQ